MGPKNALSSDDFYDELSEGLDMDTPEGRESYWGRLMDWEATHNDPPEDDEETESEE